MVSGDRKKMGQQLERETRSWEDLVVFFQSLEMCMCIGQGEGASGKGRIKEVVRERGDE